MARAFGLDRATLVEVLNPIAADQNLLRSSLLPGIWKKRSGQRAPFRKFPPVRNRTREIYPDREVPHFRGCGVCKRRWPRRALGTSNVLRNVCCPARKLAPLMHAPFEHPRRAAEIIGGDISFGRLFRVSSPHDPTRDARQVSIWI